MKATDDGLTLPPAVDVLGLPVRPLRVDDLVELLVRRGAARLRTRVCYLNAHTFNLSRDDAGMAAALCAADVLYADGQSIVWAARLLGRWLPERLTSADYFLRFAGRCAEAGLSLFLLGGGPGVAERAASALCAACAGLRIAGTQEGYYDEHESESIVTRINACGASVLLVGMGSPRQETWLARYGPRLNAPIQWCVGAQFDYLAGRERRGPAWLRDAGGEWLCRLCADPTGKWRRYLLGNARFAAAVLAARLRQTKFASHESPMEEGKPCPGPEPGS